MAQEMKFEEALKKLEKIVEELENGSISLESALEKYKEGIELSQLCSKKLEAAKKKVEILIKSQDGSARLEPFDEKEAEGGERQAETRKKRSAKNGSGLF